MQAVKKNRERAVPSWAQSLLIFISIATAAALFMIVLNMSGFLPGVGANLSAQEGRHLVTVDYRFAQEELRVKVGQTVRLVLDNQDRLPHSFDIDEWNVHVAMPGSKQVTAQFTPTEPGTYTFYCGLPGHVQAGMVGKIIVEP